MNASFLEGDSLQCSVGSCGCGSVQEARQDAVSAEEAAREAGERLSGQQGAADEAAHRLAEAENALAVRAGTLQELTLENQRLQA